MMPSELTTIISILIPVIGMQIIIMLFIFRRMDRAEERQTQERREMEQRLIRRMDRMDANQTNERRESEQRLVKRMDKTDEEVSGLRAGMYTLQSGMARVEGAAEVLRDLVDRIVTVRQ